MTHTLDTHLTQRWLHEVPHIVFASSDKPPPQTPKIVISSYQMVHRLRADVLRRAWGLVLLDESHCLRTKGLSRSEASQTCTIVKLLGVVARVVLLSGTPSPTRPLDLFLQCQAVRSGLLGRDKLDFIRNYCHVSRGRFLKVGRSKRAHELNLLLRTHVMIRRLKQEVLTPPFSSTLLAVI